MKGRQRRKVRVRRGREEREGGEGGRRGREGRKYGGRREEGDGWEIIKHREFQL